MDNNSIKHNRIKLILKITGLSLIAVGLTLVIIAFADFFRITLDDMEMPKRFWMFFVGFPLLAIGGALTMFGFKRGLMTYVKNESVPVINEAAGELDSTFSGIARSVKKGLSDDAKKCGCGAFNQKGVKFCDQCGTELTKECFNCGNKNEADAKYCNDCGKPLI